jgi:membrane-associated protease RseP (regulator of RpoE activity)
MRRYHLFPVLTFLAGLAFGFFAFGGYEQPPEKAGTFEERGVAEVRGDPGRTEPAASSTAKSLPGATFPAAIVASVPIADDNFETTQEMEPTLQAMGVAQARLQQEMARLRERVEGLEQRMTASKQTSESATQVPERPSRQATSEDRRAALVAAGVAEERAADLIWRQGQQELDRLDLRDVATREGWFGTDRYREEITQIQEDAIDMRKEIGEEVYDRYLFATGEDNRVAIDSIIPGSTAEEAGLQPGDFIESYGDTRVFRFEDLRTATSEGKRGELTQVQIRRGDSIVDAWIPRGPLGVRMDRARVDPDA